MFSKTLFALLSVLAVNAQTITSPAAIIQCQPARFELSGGEAPYIVDIIPGGDVNAARIGFIGDDLPAGGLTWIANLPAGSEVTFRIFDATGTPQYSDPITIQAGSSDSCLNETATSGIPTGAVTTTNTQSVSATSGSASSASGAASSSVASVSSAASSMMSSMTSSSPASSSSMSMSMSGSGNLASSASSAVASATESPNGAKPTAYAGAGALAAGLIGGVAMLF